MRYTPPALLAGATLLFASAALSQAVSPQAAIQSRQVKYREVGAAYKAITEELRRSAPGKFAMASSARQIAANLRQVRPLFPRGSGPEAKVKTAAKPEIWTSYATFDKLNLAATAEADKLVLAMRGTDMDAIRTQAGVVGQACKSCHQRYRTDD